MKPTDLQPGPELDALIAEKVMGWEIIVGNPSSGHDGHGVVCSGVWKKINECEGGDIYMKHKEYDGWHLPFFNWFRPSTLIAPAWEVVEKFDFYICKKDTQVMWSFTNYNGLVVKEYGQALAPTAPHAIALAALKAKGIE